MTNDLQPAETIESNDAENIQDNPETAVAIELPQIIKTTRIIAWVVLIAGGLGAFMIYNTLATTSNSSEGTAANFYAIVSSLTMLFFAVVLWAVLSILAYNSENLFYIRQDLYYKNSQ